MPFVEMNTLPRAAGVVVVGVIGNALACSPRSESHD
jgi:hypothetical protein